MSEDTVAKMEKYGGRFVKALANAWRCADLANKRTLEDAFADLFNRYASMPNGRDDDV